MTPILVAPEGTAGVTQQNFQCRSCAGREGARHFVCWAFRTLGRMARGLPPALQMAQEFSEGHGILS